MADEKFFGSADRLEIIEATIANGAAVSGVIDAREKRVSGLRMPSSWTAADVAFDESPDNAVARAYRPVYDDAGNEVTVAVSTSRSVRLDEGLLAPYRYLKLRSVTAGGGGASVNQGADRVIEVLLVPAGSR